MRHQNAAFIAKCLTYPYLTFPELILTVEASF